MALVRLSACLTPRVLQGAQHLGGGGILCEEAGERARAVGESPSLVLDN